MLGVCTWQVHWKQQQAIGKV